jgi:hypothetical protein
MSDWLDLVPGGPSSPPSWRWDLAAWLTTTGRTAPARYLDTWVGRARRHLTARRGSRRDRVVGQAAAPSLVATRLRRAPLEAYPLTGEPLAVVAGRCGVAIPPLGAYAKPDHPFHPELLTALNRKTSTIPNFRKTRGVLRPLARVVRALWQEQPGDGCLSAPPHLHLGDDRVAGDRTSRLDRPAFRQVIAADLASPRAGTRAHAREIDRDPADAGKPADARRVATTAFLHSPGPTGSSRGGSPAQGRPAPGRTTPPARSTAGCRPSPPARGSTRPSASSGSETPGGTRPCPGRDCAYPSALLRTGSGPCGPSTRRGVVLLGLSALHWRS